MVTVTGRGDNPSYTYCFSIHWFLVWFLFSCAMHRTGISYTHPYTSPSLSWFSKKARRGQHILYVVPLVVWVSPYFTMFHHISPCFTMFYHALPCFTIFYHVSARFTMFHQPTGASWYAQISRDTPTLWPVEHGWPPPTTWRIIPVRIRG